MAVQDWDEKQEEKNVSTSLIIYRKLKSNGIEKQLPFQGRRNIKYSIFGLVPRLRDGIDPPVFQS